jgi:Zn2+/Cd2+-exporting ATPase
LGVTDTGALEKAKALEAEGKSVSIVLIRNKPAGLIAMRDEPREDAIRGVAAVKALGLNPIMLTGDNRANAEAVGKALGMEVRAELLPEDKLTVIKERALDGGIAKVVMASTTHQLWPLRLSALPWGLARMWRSKPLMLP